MVGGEGERIMAASDAKARWSELLDEVERGRTIVITRRGEPIARLEPTRPARDRLRVLLHAWNERRRAMPKATLDEVRRWRHEGHRR
jgi:prevent-host-death family protein